MSSILLAVDDEGFAEDAVEAVMPLARARNATVIVLHVLDPHSSTAARARSRLVVDNTVDRLLEASISAEARYVQADRHGVARAIAGAARDYGASMIALGSRGRGDFTAMIFGSVGHRIAEETDLPLLIVRPRPAGPPLTVVQRILVAVDASAEADVAVDLAADLALRTGAMVKLIHVRYQAATEGYYYVEPEEQAHLLVEGHAKALRERGVPASAEAVRSWSPVAEQISAAAESWAADLVIVGSRRLGNVGGAVHGSISHGVVASTRRPVLIAGRPAAKARPR